MPTAIYYGANTEAVNAQLAAFTAIPRRTWVAIEEAESTGDELYSAALTAAREHGRLDDWQRAAGIARDIVDAAAVYDYPAVSVYAVGAARLAIAAEVLSDVISASLSAQLLALVVEPAGGSD